MKNIAAFFDIDGTLYREGLITELFKKMVKYEIINPEKWYRDVKPEFEKWDNRMGHYDDYLLKMAAIFTEAIKGLHKSQIEFIAHQIISRKGGRVYTYTRDMIKWHKEMGHIVITISGSPLELVREMSIKHGFNDYRGTIYLLDKGDFYTGEISPMWDSESKKRALDEFVIKYNIDMSKSYAYGDTAGDLSMLKAAKNPVCINPTKELIKHILNDNELRERVRVVVERKDMIYNLDVDCIVKSLRETH